MISNIETFINLVKPWTIFTLDMILKLKIYVNQKD